MLYINASQNMQKFQHLQTQASAWICILASIQIYTHSYLQKYCIFKRREEWPLEQLKWCFSVSLEEVYQYTIWRLSEGHIIATVTVHYIIWKMVPLTLVPIKGIFHSPINSHRPSAQGRSQDLELGEQKYKQKIFWNSK